MKSQLALVLAVAGLHIGASSSFARTCEIRLHLDDNVALGALQLTIDYSIPDGAWVPTATGIDCRGDVPNTLAPFVDDPDARIVTASFISLAGFTGPRQLAHCFFDDASGTAIPGEFVVAVQEASSVSGKILKKPRISVRMPDCGPDATTTTTTTSTTTSTTTTTAPPTTLPPSTTSTTSTSTSTTITTSTTVTTTSTTSTTLPCGNGIVEDDEECDDGNTVADDGCDDTCSSDVLCGDANGNDALSTSDALLVLRAAIGQPVACPSFRCDVDGDARVRASDSLRVLKRAVGQSVIMNCPIAG